MAKANAVVAAIDVPRVLLVDANVFFAPRLRDLFMHLHEARVLNVHWTTAIEDEWTRNVIAKQGADPGGIQACLQGMRKAAPGWRVAGYEKHVPNFGTVHAGDRHVAAAAYKLSLADWPDQPVALITKNVKHFPQGAFNGTAVTRYPMSRYIDLLAESDPAVLLKAAERCRRKLQKPHLSRAYYVAVMVKHGCQGLAQLLASHWKVECPVLQKDSTVTYV